MQQKKTDLTTSRAFFPRNATEWLNIYNIPFSVCISYNFGCIINPIFITPTISNEYYHPSSATKIPHGIILPYIIKLSIQVDHH